MKLISVCAALLFITSHAIAETNERHDFEHYFSDAGTQGTLIVYDLRRDLTMVCNPIRATTRFLPASTFKILNSLIGLETGVVRDVDHQIFSWDGVKRDIAAWNRDHTLRSAIKYSVVPVYQSIARQIGPQRMDHFVRAVGYGNCDISGVPIDQFWLHGHLRISAQEQIQFVKRLYLGDLPFSKRSMDLVKDIMVVEKTDAYTMRAKTGWATEVTPPIGWFVGWVEHGDDVDFFALNLDVLHEDQLPARISITKAVLHDLGDI
jgi:beta-lactamase class D